MKTNLEFIIAEGEGQKIEFKERWSRLDREIVAFANASGGSIFLGISDAGDITGVDISNQFVSRIQDIAQNCDPPVTVSISKHRGKVLEIQVAEGSHKPYQCREGFFLRNGPNTQKLKRAEIVQIAVSSKSYYFDETLNYQCRYPEDFDYEALEQFLKISNIDLHADAESVLLSLDIAERHDARLCLRQAGVLFFAKEPQRFLKESMVTCVRYQGTDRFSIIDRAELFGGPIGMIKESLKFIQRNINVSYQVTGDARHKQLYAYPPEAVREAIINAVMHRDYFYDGSHVYVHIFSDRLEIENPGGLPLGMTMENLGRRSVRRNRIIADLLYRAGFVERIGSGIQRMQKALAENGNPPMSISATNFFLVRFYPRVTTKGTKALTLRQNKLYQFALEKGVIAKSEAAEFLNVSGDTALREIKVLIEHGLFSQTGTGRGTRYTLK